jgi:hypothetical protein
VLLILLDGLSWAVAHELLPDLRDEGWQELTPSESGEAPPPLLATVPSATEFSRTSLLCGRLTRGDAAAEREGFAGHPGLSAACDRKHPPALFHKAKVTEGPRGGLHPDVRQAVVSDKARVVGVVVNAIDDELSGGEQIRGQWTLDRVRPLAALLQAARDGGRLVVVASDHGHVWHRDRSDYRKAAGAGERWRPADSPPGDGEILVANSRVLASGAQRVVVPWDEAIRYGIAKKGYHGGATPQEMLAPLLVLTHATTPLRSGLSPCRLIAPNWWELPLAAPAFPPVVESVTEPRRSTLGSLFDVVPVAEGSSATPTRTMTGAGRPWLDRLFESEVFRSQKAVADQNLPGDADVRRCLEVIEDSGGAITFNGLAQRAGVPAARLDDFLAKLQRLLNVDGYEVLQVDRAGNQVGLKQSLLLRQFEIE